MKFKPKVITLVDTAGNTYLAFRLPDKPKADKKSRKGDKN